MAMLVEPPNGVKPRGKPYYSMWQTLFEIDTKAASAGDFNYCAQLMEDAEGLEGIENLQSHDNIEIYEKAVKIQETYWLEEDEETMPPGDGNQQNLRFGSEKKGMGILVWVNILGSGFKLSF